MNSLGVFCFTSVARTRSFSITARELIISQQAVSRHIKVLEDELGYPLFFRNFQNVQLTEAGKIMLGYYLERDSFAADFLKGLGRPDTERALQIGCSQWLGRPSWFSALLDRSGPVDVIELNNSVAGESFQVCDKADAKYLHFTHFCLDEYFLLGQAENEVSYNGLFTIDVTVEGTWTVENESLVTYLKVTPGAAVYGQIVENADGTLTILPSANVIPAGEYGSAHVYVAANSSASGEASGDASYHGPDDGPDEASA